MFIPVTKDTLAVENRWARMIMPIENPIILDCIDKAQRSTPGYLLQNIAYLIKDVFQGSCQKRKALNEEYALEGKKFHPRCLGPRLDPGVPIFEANLYSYCGSIAYFATFMAACSGIEGSGILSGDLMIEEEKAGHTVGIFPPMEGYENGLVFEASSTNNGKGQYVFTPQITPLQAGEYDAILQGEINEIKAGRHRFVFRKQKPQVGMDEMS